MPDTTGPRSNRNPILREFRGDEITEGLYLTRPEYAERWAKHVTRLDASTMWTMCATVSQQVFAARVLYRYAAVFGGVS